MSMQPAQSTLLSVSVAIAPLPITSRALHKKAKEALTAEAAAAAAKSPLDQAAKDGYRAKAKAMDDVLDARTDVIIALQQAVARAAVLFDNAAKDGVTNAEKKQALAMGSFVVVRAAMDVLAAFSDSSVLPALQLPPALTLALAFFRSMVPSNWDVPAPADAAPADASPKLDPVDAGVAERMGG